MDDVDAQSDIEDTSVGDGSYKSGVSVFCVNAKLFARTWFSHTRLSSIVLR